MSMSTQCQLYTATMYLCIAQNSEVQGFMGITYRAERLRTKLSIIWNDGHVAVNDCDIYH